MANNCFYDLHATGNKKGIEKLKEVFLGKGDEEEIIGRVYEADIYEEGVHEQDNLEQNIYYIYICGDCAWSIQSAILDHKVLQQIIKEYNLDVEMYSEEPGMGFMEHYRWEYGEMIIDECENFEEWYIGEEEDLQEFLESGTAKELGITKDNYLDYAEDDYIRVGGLDYIWIIN